MLGDAGVSRRTGLRRSGRVPLPAWTRLNRLALLDTQDVTGSMLHAPLRQNRPWRPVLGVLRVSGERVATIWQRAVSHR